MPATRKFFRDIFGSKMFMAKDRRGGNYKSIVSMPPLDEGAPTIPSMSIFRKLEEMVTCTDSVLIVGAIIASKSSTILSSSLSRRGRSFRGAYTFIHWFSLENWIELLGKSLQDANRVTGSLAIVFARLLIQYGDGNCKKGYSLVRQ